MRYEKLFTKLFCQPVLIESGYRVGLELALLSMMDGRAPLPAHDSLRKIDDDRAVKRSDQILEVRGNTAIIHIDGAIDKNLSAMDRLCFDACDLNDVDKAISRVASDSSIDNVLFAINSPGGSFPGLPETADRIADLAETKDTIAWCGDMACSAAYWMAASCEQIVAPASASIGSIGVYLAILDQSRRMEDMGIKMQEIKSGDLNDVIRGFAGAADLLGVEELERGAIVPCSYLTSH